MFTIQYMEHLSPLQQWEVLVVAMQTYDLFLGLHLFQSRNPDVDWQCGRLLALRIPGGAAVVAVELVGHEEWRRDVPGSTAREEACSEAGSSIPDNQMLGTTALHDVQAGELVVGTFFL